MLCFAFIPNGTDGILQSFAVCCYQKNMRYLSILVLLIITKSVLLAQPTNNDKWLRSFPITDYMLDLNDSVKMVQIQLPDGMEIKEKTVGLLYGVYQTSKADAVEKGVGRCQLIKGDYYYFAITLKKNTPPPAQGDLIYLQLPSSDIFYGYLTKLAGHFIELTNVSDSAFFNRYRIFSSWSPVTESMAIAGMIEDIKWTGNYFKENNPSADQQIKSGVNKGKSTFDLMISCTEERLIDFLEYVLARPRNYAGKQWKVSEIFATWLAEGAPTVVK
jgi:hypothetical protein